MGVIFTGLGMERHYVHKTGKKTCGNPIPRCLHMEYIQF